MEYLSIQLKINNISLLSIFFYSIAVVKAVAVTVETVLAVPYEIPQFV